MDNVFCDPLSQAMILWFCCCPFIGIWCENAGDIVVHVATGVNWAGIKECTTTGGWLNTASTSKIPRPPRIFRIQGRQNYWDVLTFASTSAILILSTSMAVGIGRYLRSKTRGRRCGKFAVDATEAVDTIREGLYTPSTMRKIRGRRGI